MSQKTNISELEESLLYRANKVSGIHRGEPDLRRRIHRGHGMRLFNPTISCFGERAESIEVDIEDYDKVVSGSYDETGEEKVFTASFSGVYDIKPCPGKKQVRTLLDVVFKKVIDDEVIETILTSIDSSRADTVLQGDYGALIADTYSVGEDGRVSQHKERDTVGMHDISLLVSQNHSENITAYGEGEPGSSPLVQGYETRIVRPNNLGRDIDVLGKQFPARN